MFDRQSLVRGFTQIARGVTPKEGVSATTTTFQAVRLEATTLCEDGGAVAFLSIGPDAINCVLPWPEELSATPWLVLPEVCMAGPAHRDASVASRVNS